MTGNFMLVAGIVLWGYVLTGILKIKEGFGPVLAIAVSMAVLEIGGAFGVLWPTAKIYCIAVGIFIVIYTVLQKEKEGVKAYFLNPAVIGFFAAGLFYLLVTSGEFLLFTKPDSFLHWGMFSKAVFYHHNLDVWSHELAVNHRVYPHGMAAWYSLFALGKRVYSERDVMLSINVLLFASSCPIVDLAAGKIRKLLPDKKITPVFLYLISAISVAGLLWIWRFEGIWAYTSGYMDIPLGAAFMASLCLVVTDGRSDYRKALGVSLLSAMLVMIKPSGIIFVCTVCLIYLLNECSQKEQRMSSDPACKLICVWSLGITAAIPLLELAIWNTMMKYLGITGGNQFRLKDFLPGMMIEKYQSDAAYAELFWTVISNFITAFFTRNVVLCISAFGWMAICIAIVGFILLFLKDRYEKRKVLYVNLGMLLMFCLYNLFLLWTYLTTMSEEEAIAIVCYDRYVGSYVIGWFVLELYLLFFYSGAVLKVQYLYFGGFILCNLFGFLDKSTYLKEIDPEFKKNGYELGEKIRECIPEITDHDFDSMPDLWISYAEQEQSLSSDQVAQLKYYLFPDFDLINIYGIQGNYNRQMQDIVAEFDFDYVVLYGVNDEFYDAYYWFFSDGLSNAAEQYENGQYQAYQVIRDQATNEFCWFEPIQWRKTQ